MSGIDGRKALVTGGASGIGLAIAHRLRERGAHVAVLDLPSKNLDDVKADGYFALPADVRSASEVASAVARATAYLGGLDTVILSAGVIHIKPLSEVTEEEWDTTLDVNLKGAFLVAQATAPSLSDSTRGRIVLIGSDAGRSGVPFLQAYSASKAGLIGLAQSLAGELAPAVTVNCICPVSTPETAMGQQVLSWKASATERPGDQVLQDLGSLFPMGRPGSREDIANAAEFLVSDKASFITGVALDIDGGASLNSMPGASAC